VTADDAGLVEAVTICYISIKMEQTPTLPGHRFEVLRLLGEGSDGQVLEVRDRARGGLRCALKVGTGPAAVQAFGAIRHEFQVLASLAHPQLARVLDFGLLGSPEEEPGGALPFYTRELIEGEARPAGLASTAAGEDGWVAGLVRLVGALHARSVLHRDLKPANLLFRSRARGPEPVILDFGLAGPGGSGGTLAYLAPERIRGEPAAVGSDLYALGATLFELLVGEPLIGPSAPEVAIQRILAGAGGRRARRDGPLGAQAGAVAALVAALVDPEPARRPGSAQEALALLLGRPEAEVEPAAPEAIVPPPLGPPVALEALLRAAEAGGCLLLGPAGAGKTRLLEEARWRLQVAGRSVACLTASSGPSSLADLASRLAALSPRSTGSRADALAPREAEIEAVATAAAAAAGPAGLALVVDDLDQADEDLRAGLAHLGRGAADLHLVILAAARQAVDLGPGSALPVVRLAPLDAPAARALVAPGRGGLPDRVVDRIVALGDGNPGLLLHLAWTARRRGASVADLAALEACGGPAALGAAERERALAVAGPGAAEALLALATCSHPVPAGAAPAGPAGWLERLVAAGLLPRQEDALGPLRPALRQAVLAAGTAEARAAVHRGWLERLGGPGVDPVARASHWTELPPTPDGVPEVAAAAAELRRQGAVERAAAHLGWCRAAPDLPTLERLELALGQVEALVVAGRYGEAEAVLREVTAPPDAPTLAARRELALAEVRERQGRLDGAAALLGAAAARTGVAADVAAAIALGRARLLVRQGAPGPAREVALAARGAAPAGRVRALLGQVAGVAATELGHRAEAETLLDAAAGEAQEAGQPQVEGLVRSQQALLAHRQGRPGEAVTRYRQALALAEAAGDQGNRPGYLLNLGTALQDLGQLGEALERYRQAAGLARRLGRDATLATALSNLGNLLVEVGALDAAGPCLAEAASCAAGLGLRVTGGLVALYQAEAARAAGRREDAGALARTAAGALRAADQGALAARAELVLADLALDVGRTDEALAWITAAGEAAGPGDEAVAAPLEITRGRHLAATGQVEAARAALEHAGRLADARGEPALALEALARLVDVEAGAGRPGAAGELAARAAALRDDRAASLPAELRARFAADPRWAAVRRWASLAAGREGADGGRTAAGPVLSRVLRLNRDLLAERDTPALLARILDTAIELTGAERGFLLLRDADGELRVEVARNIDRESLRRGRLKVSRSLARSVAETGVPIVTVSAQEDERLQLYASVSELGLTSVVAVPIRTAERIEGTLYLDNRFVRGRFTEADLEVLQAFADQVAVALSSARLTAALAERTAALERAEAELRARAEAQAAELAAAREVIAQVTGGLRHDYGELLGRSAAMRRVLTLVDRVVEPDVSVLIQGESGTGKELVARTIHRLGPRRDHRFVAINCGALPDSLLESELFGHVKGAFTGADRDREGLFRVAHHGTIFLDEVGETSPSMQAKLLRVLQEREVRPVGGTRDVAVDVRVLAATNRDLAAMVAAGSFRQDLFYRLCVVAITLPPLRERREDLPLLAAHLLDRAAADLGVPARPLSRAALARLGTHDWPGNVRELENALRAALLLGSGSEIGAEDLVLRPAPAPGRSGAAGSLRDQQREAVDQALREAGGRVALAARRLGVSRVTLYRWIKTYGLRR
jgi:transcriptional regulator with GAF, ATPase, and Fis domain/serine/threonine protein kinase